MIHHHPVEELLLEYASGVLPLSQKLAVTVHLQYCDHCRQRYARLRELGGALLNELPDQNSDTESLTALKQKIMSQLAHYDAEPSQSHDPALLDSMQKEDNASDPVPAILRRWIPKGFNDLAWFSLKPGFKVVTLFKSGRTRVSLSRVKPGGKMAAHRHTGVELTVVLKGAFSDGDGLYKKGDFIYRDSKDLHDPIVTKDDECICLMVTEAPIQFTGKLARLLNPVLRWQHN